MNNMKKIISILLALSAFGFLPSAFALQGESIVFDPATGNYLITYRYSPDKKLHQVTFIPATKINPTINSKLKLEQDGIVHYGYMLSSGRDSQQDIVLFILDPVSSVTSSLPDIPLNAPPGQIMDDMMSVANYFDTPAPWYTSMGYSDGQMSFRIGWSSKVVNGLHPGSKAVFGFKSRDLPGIIQAEVYGYAPGSQEIPGEETQDANDGGFGQQYTELLDNSNFLHRATAVPTIAVPDPFDAAVLLGSIQTQMHTWIGMKLLDATFSSQLDRYFQSAISAYHLNQSKVGKKQIQTMRELIKKEQPDLGRDEEHESDKSHEKNDDKKPALIDRLAARILDFDLSYVTKRMGGDKDD
jgi:hypothetical protein